MLQGDWSTVGALLLLLVALPGGFFFFGIPSLSIRLNQLNRFNT